MADFQGLSFISENYRYFGSLQGLSFVSENYKYVGNFRGLSIESYSNLTFNLFDNQTLLPISAVLNFNNQTYPADPFSNGDSNFASETHSIIVNNDSTITVNITLSGYQAYTADYIIDSEQDTYIDVFLIPTTTQNLICDSFIGTATGVQTNAIIKGEDNYLFCDFTIPAFVSANDWSIVFSGFPLNGDKKSSQNYTATYFGLVGTNKHRWRAKLNGSEDNYGFTARIRKNI